MHGRSESYWLHLMSPVKLLLALPLCFGHHPKPRIRRTGAVFWIGMLLLMFRGCSLLQYVNVYLFGK
jgi:hypothetical protein